MQRRDLIKGGSYLKLRDEVKKSKWKFKMAFAIRGGGLEGVSFAIRLF